MTQDDLQETPSVVGKGKWLRMLGRPSGSGSDLANQPADKVGQSQWPKKRQSWLGLIPTRQSLPSATAVESTVTRLAGKTRLAPSLDRRRSPSTKAVEANHASCFLISISGPCSKRCERCTCFSRAAHSAPCSSCRVACSKCHRRVIRSASLARVVGIAD